MIFAFTFHNVSINSKKRLFALKRVVYYLHSIMYLLIHVYDEIEDDDLEFTFHNVSINSNE